MHCPFCHWLIRLGSILLSVHMESCSYLPKLPQIRNGFGGETCLCRLNKRDRTGPPPLKTSSHAALFTAYGNEAEILTAGNSQFRLS